MTHPVTLIRQGEISPLVLDSPHSGVDYPEDFQYRVNFADLRRAEDTHVDGLFDFCSSIGASMVAAQFPRSYIDANRSLEEIDPELLETPWPRPYTLSNKAKLGKGLIWRMLDDGQNIYARKLSVAEIEHRIRHCWNPYHALVKETLSQAYEQHGFFIFLLLSVNDGAIFQRFASMIYKDMPFRFASSAHEHNADLNHGVFFGYRKVTRRRVALNIPGCHQEVSRPPRFCRRSSNS